MIAWTKFTHGICLEGIKGDSSMSGYFEDYDRKYPNLVLEIIDYFDMKNREPDIAEKKTILKLNSVNSIKMVQI